MKLRDLKFPTGYDQGTQNQVGLFAAQFDDQLRLLKEAVAGLTVEQLQWQPHSGMNTIGMLMAHLAVVEVFWINVAAREMNLETDGEALMKATIGINMDDDGLPQKPGGLHPPTLQNKLLEQYLAMLDLARASVHAELRQWQDVDLEKTFQRRDWSITRLWTLYHVLEHFAGHFGQILLLEHMMRDAGILPPKAEK